MNTSRTLTKIGIAGVAGAALLLTTLPRGSALAEEDISKSADGAPIGASDLALWQSQYGSGPSASDDGDVDGRDFLVWQRGESPASAGDLADWQANYGSGGY